MGGALVVIIVAAVLMIGYAIAAWWDNRNGE